MENEEIKAKVQSEESKLEKENKEKKKKLSYKILQKGNIFLIYIKKVTTSIIILVIFYILF